MLGISTKLVVISLHQRKLLFSVVTRLVTGAGTALGLFTHFTFRDLLLQILVDKLWRGSIRRVSLDPKAQLHLNMMV